jgi:hypothetical protein
MLIDARKITINFPSRKDNSTEPYFGVLIYFLIYFELYQKINKNNWKK